MKFQDKAAALVVLVGLQAAAAQTPAGVTQLLADEDVRLHAAAAHDSVALAKTVDDGLHYVHSSGLVQDKTAYVAFNAKPIAPGSQSMTTSDRVALVRGDLGVIRGELHVTVGGKGTDVAYIAVYKLESGHWKLLDWDSTHLSGAKL